MAEANVTPVLLKNLNKVLENDSPSALVPLLENFICLLRNKEKTKAEDVELFLADAGKLKAKMSKTTTTSCSLEIVEQVLARVKTLEGPANSSEFDMSPYMFLLEWSKDFCEAARIDLRLFAMENEINAIKHKVDLRNLQVARYDTLFKDNEELGFSQFFDNSIANIEGRLVVMNQVTEIDQNQALEYQKNLSGFEKTYFAEYIRLAQNQ